MYSGRTAIRCARSASVSAAYCRGRIVGHRALVSGSILAGRHHRFAYRGMFHQSRSISPQLDTESPDLNLKIVAPKKLDVAVGKIAAQIPGPVHPRARLVDKRIGQNCHRTDRTATALYMRGTDPDHHIHVTEKGDPKFSGSPITSTAKTT